MGRVLRRVTNRLNLMLRRPTPRHVVAITYALTYRCNSRCAHCGTWQHKDNESAPTQPELTAGDVATIWRANAAYLTQLQSLHLTGGEPFLRPDLGDIGQYALKRFAKARVHISTNGLNADRIVTMLSKMGDPRRICLAFSLDGPDDVYKTIRGVDRFTEVRDTLQRVRRTFPEMALGVNATALPQNAAHLATIRSIAQSVGAEFGMQVVHTSTFYHNVGQHVACRPEDLHHVSSLADTIVREHRETHGLLKSLVGVEPYYYAHMAQRAAAVLPRPADQRCLSGTHSLFLDPYGFVFPCIILSAPMGRLPQQTLRDFWHGDGACSARRDIARGACQCWTSCEAFPSLSRDFGVIGWNLRRLWRA